MNIEFVSFKECFICKIEKLTIKDLINCLHENLLYGMVVNKSSIFDFDKTIFLDYKDLDENNENILKFNQKEMNLNIVLNIY